MKRILAVLSTAVALVLTACSSGGYGTVGSADTSSGNGAGGTPPPPPTSNTALFQPSAGVLPYPTDLYFAGSKDGTINIQPPNAAMPNQAAINGLDGFSTTAVIRENFGGALDPASFTASSVIIIPVVIDDLHNKATIGVLGAPLTLGVDYTVGLGTEAGVGSSVLEITPLHPLMPSTCIKNGQFLGAACTTSTGYLVLLTRGIKDAQGNAAVPSADFSTILTALGKGDPTCPSITDPTLNGICQLTAPQLQIAGNFGVTPADVVLSFSFTTQSTLDTLEALSARTTGSPVIVHPIGITTADLGLGLPGHADIYVGTIYVQYSSSKTAPLTDFWHAPPFPRDPTSTFVTRYNPLPVATPVQLPVLITVPNASSALGAVPPPGGWPVLIFQHGITRNREDAFAVADSFGDAGFVVVAIDLPLHGITNPNDPLYASSTNPSGAYLGLGLPASGSIERTFDLSTSGNGSIDPSGSHFINLTSLLTTRDNLRQGVVDLMTLVRSMPAISAAIGDLINPSEVHYLGHSLGAIEGGTFLGVMPSAEVLTATLAMPGGKLANLLRESPAFAPQINAGLAAAGINQGTTLYEQFFRDAQTAVDSGDPVNFIAQATALHPIHLIQVVGGGASLPDQVVPNSATQRLIVASSYGPAALTRIPAPAAPGPVQAAGGFRAYVNFVVGDHGSIIDPTASPAATFEMQTEAASFTGQPVPPNPQAGFPGFPVTTTPGTTIFVAVPPVIQP
jgi:pimeloyl-ACP methyl ester carboxylesterase